MAKNYLLIYSEQLATDIELLCQNIKAPSNTLFQIRKSSSSVYANIQEANYGQSKADMLSKFEISLKECSYQYCKRRKSISSSGILRYWKRAVTSLMAEKQILRQSCKNARRVYCRFFCKFCFIIEVDLSFVFTLIFDLLSRLRQQKSRLLATKKLAHF